MRATVSLITGGAGFIGSHLARRLVERGDEVHVLVRPTTSLTRLEPIATQLRVHRQDFFARAALADCLSAINPDRVFHLAAETRPAASFGLETARSEITSHVDALASLLGALSELSKPPSVVVRAGSIAEYGTAPVPFRESQREQPCTAYGAAMTAGTRYLSLVERMLPFPVVSARLALVYGPGQSESFLIPALIRSCLQGRPFTIGRPEDRRDLIHVDDAVRALEQLAAWPPPGCSVVNIASGIAPTMREVAEIILRLTGGNRANVTMRDRLDEAPSELRCSADLARLLIGWQSDILLEAGLNRTIAATRTALLNELIDAG